MVNTLHNKEISSSYDQQSEERRTCSQGMLVSTNEATSWRLSPRIRGDVWSWILQMTFPLWVIPKIPRGTLRIVPTEKTHFVLKTGSISFVTSFGSVLRYSAYDVHIRDLDQIPSCIPSLTSNFARFLNSRRLDVSESLAGSWASSATITEDLERYSLR